MAVLRKFLLFSAVLVFGFVTRDASALSAEITAEVVEGSPATFGRMVVDFVEEDLAPPYTSSANNNVLVLSFDDEFETSIDGLATTLRDFVGVARVDPDSRGVRMSLTRGTRVDIKSAGEKIFVDFLPRNWRGLPPPLPDEVIQELAKRAAEAIKAVEAAEASSTRRTVPPRLDLSVGRHPTFSRFSFRWNVPFSAAFVRDGEDVAVNFDNIAPLDVGPLLADLPAGLVDLDTFAKDGQLNVVFSVAEGANVRAFRDGDVYVVDITAPDEEDRGGIVSEDTGNAATTIMSGELVNDLPQVSPTADQVIETVGNAMRAPTDPVAERLAATQRSLQGALVRQQQSQMELLNAAEEDEQEPDATAIVIDDPEADSPETAQTDRSNLFVDARLEDSNAIFSFPFSKPTSAAFFRKGFVVWMIFDTDQDFQTGLLDAIAAGIEARIEMVDLPGARAFRLEFPYSPFVNASKNGDDWNVFMGASALEPGRGIPLSTAIDEDGRAEVEAEIDGIGKIHRYTDPKTGDPLFVVTSFGPVQSLLRDQTFTELHFYSSAHGLAGTSYVDDLMVRTEEDRVLVGRNQGLSLSSNITSSTLQLSARLQDMSDEVEADNLAAGFDVGRSLKPSVFRRQTDELEHRIATAEPSARLKERFVAVRSFLGNGMASEALGMLNLITRDDPVQAQDPDLLLLRGAARTLANRSEQGLQDFSDPALEDSADAAFWTTIAASQMGDWEKAFSKIKRGRAILGSYPGWLQHQFQLAAAKAALEFNDRGYANELLSEINPSDLSEGDLAKYLLLRGRIADGSGERDLALRSWEQVKRLSIEGVTAEADLMIFRQQYEIGERALPDLERDLKGLGLRWRGDDIELATLRMLARIHADRGHFRDAFQAMKTAVLVDEGSETTRKLQDDIAAQFEDLFLHGRASEMNPIEALALYYDFRELTPIGAKGDEMVRKLAARLVDVDLLDQASELLAHQVENRLRGTARAQIAADLAFVHILNDQPNRALQVLRRTRQARLPSIVDRQRRLLEAKALAETGKADIAVALLDSLNGADVARLIADIHWENEQWQEAGNGFERVLGEVWSDPLPIDELNRLDVLRAGIGFALANDELGLQRLRSKFAAKMAETEDASAFDIITSSAADNSIEFRTLTQAVSDADVARNFLSEYRRRYLAPPQSAFNAPSAEATQQNDDGLAVDRQGA